ncbi:hypothetical protein PTSG_10558 [Salpingoeca rosetta]|uniref:Uncharacterized protein n=1 Tax=Salpingoeca rosetta (strain ATCC 50818 / BSB-021) TaxID=946362 RepID=F2URP8_SALR5|nr:uncharacterized protein PTSG_10558 [Salpingoeca rosetta]EGD80303.1 hypothetical protein PTSG_10558 [Salpingoeca rosetta]|eukprot:XP_004988093.1 hypothetical protein PTSG_10558 [Salpingoeca rosetta]
MVGRSLRLLWLQQRRAVVVVVVAAVAAVVLLATVAFVFGLQGQGPAGAGDASSGSRGRADGGANVAAHIFADAQLEERDDRRVLARLIDSVESMADTAQGIRHALEKDPVMAQQPRQQQQSLQISAHQEVRTPPHVHQPQAVQGHGEDGSPQQRDDAEVAIRKANKKGPPKHRAIVEGVPVSWQVVQMCRTALWDALRSCTTFLPPSHPEAVHGDAFVITGDIDDLWLRDSAAQVHPYIPMTPHNATLARLVEGLAHRHAFYIDYEPYANAFRLDTNYKFSDTQKALGRHGYISTFDYELDSGCYFLRMLHAYWRANPKRGQALIASSDVKRAVITLLDVWTAEQRHEEDHTAPDRGLYRRPYVPSEPGKPWTGFKGLPRDGKGTPVAYTGMTWSAFRPSDDEQQYGYLVPSNMFAVVVLGYAKEMALNVWHDDVIASRASTLALDIDSGIRNHAIVHHPQFGNVYAYEVDGLGNHLLTDDANVPSLLSIPYLGYNYDKDAYTNTRRFLLSSSNPTFATSRDGRFRGIGSVHMRGAIKNNIWPMSLIMQGLTSTSVEEKQSVLDMLVKSTGGTQRMHESFDADNPSKFTRKWFSWANALFAEYVRTLTDECV